MIRISKKKKERILTFLVDKCHCGPFDGCCLIYAEALQMKFGGEIYVLFSRRFAEHAVLFLEGQLVDFDGPLEPEEFLVRYSENEIGNKILGYRKFESSDLCDMQPDKEISRQIVEML